MIPVVEPNRKTAVLVALAVALLLAPGCTAARRDLVGDAIEARGGPLASYRKKVDADVAAGLPGNWAWEVAYRVPHQFGWILETLGEEQGVLFDGREVRHRVGEAVLAPTPADREAWSQSWWFGATSLDVLREPGVSLETLPSELLPGGTQWGLRVRHPSSPEPIELFFDEDLLLVGARGFVALPPIGAGRVQARFSEFRETDGYLLPYRADYELEGHPFARETVRWWRPNDPPSGDTTFFSGQ